MAYLGKDEVKEALMDALSDSSTVAESQRLGRAAVHAVLRAAQGCPDAVVDSTWYPYALPLVRELRGPLIEIRCRVPVEVAQRRYAERRRDGRHLDSARTADELWGSEVAPLGVGRLIEVDTSDHVDVTTLAREIGRYSAEAARWPCQ